jgi:glycosyltransferase involved in cell wall biosynthesis
VVLSTYNRSRLLRRALEHLLDQRLDGLSFEILVVDNNSSDGTATVVERLAEQAPARLRYLFEPAQGISHARNAGIRQARAPIVAFTDDDVCAPPDWVASLARAFEEYPGAQVVGGRVLPMWPTEPPAWLTPEHWSPLALVDYGEDVQPVDRSRPRCLVGANMAFRRSVFERIGLFATSLQRVRDTIGSLEDHEFLTRLFRRGGTGVYDPRVVMFADVQHDRLRKAYHRQWHEGHGHFYAVMRDSEVERSQRGQLLGVPAHMYRQLIGSSAGWLVAMARGDTAAAFTCETRMRFFLGFFRTRSRQRDAAPDRALVRPPVAMRAWLARLRGHPAAAAAGRDDAGARVSKPWD